MNKPQWGFPKISKDQYLKDITDHIPSLIILFKILTGIGATTLEIEYALRNSILIEPNLPVILGKCAKYNTKSKKRVLGVYEGVTVDHIIDYLESDVTPKKIITTPESYIKVKQAFEELGIDMYSHSFMLFDECERTIQDVGYRTSITLPIQDFFKFKEKAFISATPIIPSDPNFVKQGFKHVYIKPDYDYREDLNLIVTNNVQFSFAKYIEENPREQYFIFFNSTDTIAHLITSLEIKDQSAVFCARESKNKLKVNDFKHVSTSLGKFHKFNFFTSRFFSAVDIDDIPNPTIIILSDLVSAEHSMIDPKSEAIQIVGRFRKIKGVEVIKEITHITNIEPMLVSKTEAETLEYIKEGHVVMRTLKHFLAASTTTGARDVLREIMKRIEFAKYLNKDGTKNYFMQDNTVYEEKIKGYYQSIKNLKKAYAESNNFNVTVDIEKYEFTDLDRARTNKQAPLKTVFEVVMPVIKELYESDANPIMRAYQMETLKKEFPEVVKAFNKIGLEEARKLNFNHKKIRNAIREKEFNDQSTHFGFLEYLERNFIEGFSYSSESISNKTRNGLIQHNLKLLSPGVKLLNKYCQLSDRITIDRNSEGKEIKGYRVIRFYNKIKS